MATPAAEAAQRLALAIGELGKFFVRAGVGEAGIVEFVAADFGSCPPQRAIRKQAGAAVAEVHLARRETGGMAEQAEHAVLQAFRVFQHLAQHHEAAALAMDGRVSANWRMPARKLRASASRAA